ncbi:MAG: hypothetical protein UU73_C0005G0035 [Candidatus Daviesbacteria bacterium GW2011_GWA1_41_61]|uniref:Uncharacterized protein n=1 Tax=Candidatus Daviesbacteria bacterium GW2011_GWA2_40_9 TaxID=1618424 RepID=A0A0G0U8T0_9BACT|nr:MAG: hypothetical protein UU26_C0023G0011 [Candidatus Daviesbacteria bacterium GW2011_GWC1_40_9]KKR83636.1 MAG: hypothetical protein UU29_C0003G0038 [Candidatus Daviesbacteria bacterium GW2011_GWA2_40_9]KKR92705.1 MAG: hypothetical protein UU44_C0005G0035 [Candidatus Daviesbacteria bacterium GW2011_GWB1_41_15]KKS14636.1 MAG: hypothetical protein UU73_C0005G0035 [Candidatus Daviesbacteria bacterium GW2011_GWA1_41_61]
MVKFLPLVLLISLMMGVLAYVRIYRVADKSSPIDPLTTLTETFQLTQASPTPENLPAVISPASSSGKEKPSPTPSKIDSQDLSLKTLQTQVRSLERTVADLQLQVNDLKEPKDTVSTTKAPLYIPLGTGGASSALDWTAVDALQITLDPADYPGYKSMQLEVSLRVFQGNGKAYARIYNSDDKLALLPSEVSVTTESYSWVNSQGFILTSGKKIYKLQLKTNTGYEAGIQNARIKVNF